MAEITEIRAGVVALTPDGRRVLVRRLSSVTEAVVMSLASRQDETIKVSELRADATLLPERQDTRDIDDDALTEAFRRFELIEPIVRDRTRDRELVERIAAAEKVHRATIYRWVAQFKTGSLVTALLRKQRSDRGSTRVSLEVEKIIGEVIVEYYLTLQKRTPQKAYRELERRCRINKLAAPSMTTFRGRLSKLSLIETAKKREGDAAALKFDVNKGSVPYADYPYALLQVDHTLLDVMLVDDEHRLAIGRPWLTLLIDVYSRMVAGYYISFETPGTIGTGMAIAHAILPKDQTLARLGLSFDYPAMGIPRVIHWDNAREFHGRTLKQACLAYGTDLVFRKIKKPHYGAHIERLLGTLAREIHALEGATFADHKHRQVYDSDGRACMTISELEKWFGNLVFGIYHHRVHKSLGCSPLERYAEGILGSDTTPGRGSVPSFADPDRIRIDFLPVIERTIQYSGVEIDKIEYYADVLRRYVGSTEPNQKSKKRLFRFRRDPRDISSILFYEPELARYFKIPYRDASRPPMSLWDLRATKARLKKQGKGDANEEEIFRGYEEMRKIEDESAEKTKKARLQRAKRRDVVRSRAHGEGPAQRLPPEPVFVEPTTPSPVQPFEEIERY